MTKIANRARPGTTTRYVVTFWGAPYFDTPRLAANGFQFETRLAADAHATVVRLNGWQAKVEAIRVEGR